MYIFSIIFLLLYFILFHTLDNVMFTFKYKRILQKEVSFLIYKIWQFFD